MLYMKKMFRWLWNAIVILFTGGKHGQFIEGKLCPKCHVRRIKLHKKCCGPCYDKYFA